MTLTYKQLRDVCLIESTDNTKVCRYLSQDELDQNKWYCQKLNLIMKSKIDRNVLFDIKGEVASGNNCAGYPLLRNIKQGYDVD